VTRKKKQPFLNARIAGAKVSFVMVINSTFPPQKGDCTLMNCDRQRNFKLRLEMDNNSAERAIKPFVMGRKAWLFSNTPKGAESSAILYSIVKTAKGNRLKPYPYLVWLFEQMPNAHITDVKVLDRFLFFSRNPSLRIAECRHLKYNSPFSLCLGVLDLTLTIDDPH